MIISFTSSVVNPIAICDRMQDKYRWSLSKLQEPLGAHLAVTASNAPNWKKLISDLQQCIEDLKADPVLNHNSDTAVYGMASAIPDKNFLKMFFHLHTEEYLDAQ